MLAGISGVACGSTGTGSGAGLELPKLGNPPKLPQPASARAKSIAAAGAKPRLNLLMACLSLQTSRAARRPIIQSPPAHISQFGLYQLIGVDTITR